MSRNSRAHSFRRTRVAGLTATGLALVLAAPAGAQDLTFRFIDPSFGGNPFYADHLLNLANLDRPAQRTTPTPTVSQEELIAQQLRAQLLSQLSGTIQDEIRNAAVGASNTFTFGNQTIMYSKTATGTTVTFTNTTTGETNTITLPASSSASGSAAGTTSAAAASVAAAGSRSVATTAVAPGSVSGVSLGASAPLGYTAGRALAGAAASAPIRGSAEQALIATSTTTGSALPPL